MVRQAFPVRGNNQLITRRYGSPLDGIRSTAFLAKGLACSSVCRLSLGSDIHSRMIFRRISCSGLMLKILALDRCHMRGHAWEFVQLPREPSALTAIISAWPPQGQWGLQEGMRARN